jgi:hypothetical protein
MGFWIGAGGMAFRPLIASVATYFESDVLPGFSQFDSAPIMPRFAHSRAGVVGLDKISSGPMPDPMQQVQCGTDRDARRLGLGGGCGQCAGAKGAQ